MQPRIAKNGATISSIRTLVFFVAQTILGILVLTLMEFIIRVLMFIGILPHVPFVQADLLAFGLGMAIVLFLPRLWSRTVTWRYRRTIIGFLLLANFSIPFLMFGFLEPMIRVQRALKEIPTIPGMTLIDTNYTRGDGFDKGPFVDITYILEDADNRFAEVEAAFDDKAMRTGWKKAYVSRSGITYYLRPGSMVLGRLPCKTFDRLCVRRNYRNFPAFL